MIPCNLHLFVTIFNCFSLFLNNIFYIIIFDDDFEMDVNVTPSTSAETKRHRDDDTSGPSPKHKLTSSPSAGSKRKRDDGDSDDGRPSLKHHRPSPTHTPQVVVSTPATAATSTALPINTTVDV